MVGYCSDAIRIRVWKVEPSQQEGELVWRSTNNPSRRQIDTWRTSAVFHAPSSRLVNILTFGENALAPAWGLDVFFLIRRVYAFLDTLCACTTFGHHFKDAAPPPPVGASLARLHASVRTPGTAGQMFTLVTISLLKKNGLR